MEVVFGNAVELSQNPFRLVPELLDAVDVVVAIGEQLRMIDADVVEVRDVEGVVACPGVRIDDAMGNGR